MKTPVNTDSRVAHYMRLRREFPLSRVYRARDMWARAEAATEKAKAAREAWEAAKAALSEFWESLGRKEPKQYGPDGQRLSALRAAERAASKAYFRAWAPNPSAPYFHSKPEAMAIPRADGEFFFPRAESMFRIHEGDSGYYSDPLCIETVIPVVAFLPGKGGQCRAVPGYRFSEWEAGAAVLDMSDIREGFGDDSDSLLRDCMATAESMAEQTAQEERDFQAAWEAGALWADMREKESDIRKRILAILKERKEARGGPTLCAAIRDHVAGLLDDLRENREARPELQEGARENHWFDSWRPELQKAFREGAGL